LVPEARGVLYDACEKTGITPRIVGLSDISGLSVTGEGSTFTYKGVPFKVSMIGMHQVKNALNVIGACEEIGIPLATVSEGISKTVIPGRFQIIKREPLCVLDGAHNPDKIAGVCEVLDDLYKDKKIITVFGMQKKKDYKKAIPEIAKRSDVFIATVPNGVHEALSAEEAASVAGDYCGKVLICEDPVEAGALACSTASPQDLVLATGSIYLLADALSGIKRY
ncbi:MAG: hypothetical protein IJS65_00165, partial [Clostridia bacterium]|nr:hypothetical protein [Clostridia bacterium]